MQTACFHLKVFSSHEGMKLIKLQDDMETVASMCPANQGPWMLIGACTPGSVTATCPSFLAALLSVGLMCHSRRSPFGCWQNFRLRQLGQYNTTSTQMPQRVGGKRMQEQKRHRDSGSNNVKSWKLTFAEE
eukprot:scaffold79370_cov18-Tisochrysis_lutea.AAC.2